MFIFITVLFMNFVCEIKTFMITSKLICASPEYQSRLFNLLMEMSKVIKCPFLHFTCIKN